MSGFIIPCPSCGAEDGLTRGDDSGPPIWCQRCGRSPEITVRAPTLEEAREAAQQEHLRAERYERLIASLADGMRAAINHATEPRHFVRRLEALIDEAEDTDFLTEALRDG